MALTARDRRLHTILIVGVTLVAAWLRLWQLPQLPPGFWRDEAYNAMDAHWMWQQLAPQLFLVGNTGREVLLHYLGALAMLTLGAQPFAFRLVAALTGIITVPLLYRWLTTLWAGQRHGRWLAVLAASGLAVSLWHVTMSRTGYRAIFVPLFYIAISYVFWLAWRRRSGWLFAAAGLLLGLSQYTYLSARLLPLIFIAFAPLWMILRRRSASLSPAVLWRGLLLTAAASILVFLPLGLYFWQNPSAFVGRSADISLANQAAQTGLPLAAVLQSRLFDALRVFVDGGIDPNWRHTLVGVAGFDWLMRVGFWLGLVVSVKNIRRPEYLWLLVSLIVLWLPAPLAQVGTLRLSGFLAPYFAVMALGWGSVLSWLASRLSPAASHRLFPLAIALFLAISGTLTGVNYFPRWGTASAVYRDFNGPVVDLTRHLLDASRTHDLLLPFEVYTHPTVRFLLAADFTEQSTLPPDSGRPALVVNVPDMADLPPETVTTSYVWLTRHAGRGLAYTLAPFQPADLNRLQPTGPAQPFVPRHTDEPFASLIPIAGAAPFVAATNHPPARANNYTWGDQLRLIGHDILPPQVSPGESPVLNLTWQNLTGQPLPVNIFIQLVDGQGHTLAQWTDGYLADQHRWRKGLLSPTQHRLWLDPNIEPGPYLVRVGLFDPVTGQRLPVTNAAGQPLGDQVYLGLFYVGQSPCPNRIPLAVTLGQAPGDQVRLLGYALPPVADPASLPVCLFWQADDFIRGDYTVFAQLLDAGGQRVAGWDSPPLAGTYPTSAWSPGELIIDPLNIPLPAALPPGEYRLVVGLYNFETGQRLPVTSDGQRQPDDMIILRETTLP